MRAGSAARLALALSLVAAGSVHATGIEATEPDLAPDRVVLASELLAEIDGQVVDSVLVAAGTEEWWTFGRAGRRLQVWRPGEVTVRRSKVASPPSEAGGAADSRAVRTETVVRTETAVSAPQPLYSIPLPADLRAADAGVVDGLQLRPFASRQAWLVDLRGARAWRLRGHQWLGPWSLGDAIGWSAATPDGELVVTTPGHGAAAFALFNRRGELVKRFGERRGAMDERIREQANSWVLAGLADGDLLAAHRHGPWIRRYAPDGSLRWERDSQAPPVAALEISRFKEETRLARAPSGACFTCRHVLYAGFVSGLPERGFVIQYGVSPALQRFDDSGAWQEQLVVRPAVAGEEGEGAATAPAGIWRHAGFAVLDHSMLAVEGPGLVRYPRPRTPGLDGEVTAEGGAPVPGASVEWIPEEGRPVRDSTGVGGRFRLPLATERDAGTLRVSAAGFQPGVWTGRLGEILAGALELRPALEQCVRVLDGLTGKPVRRFSVQIDRVQRDAGSVSVSSLVDREVETDAGEVCLRVPAPPPWDVRLGASGYATAEIELREVEPVEVDLLPGAELIATVVGPDGDPVSEARVTVLEPSEADRGARSFASSRLQVTDGEGEARFEGLVPGRYTVALQHARHLPSERDVELVAGTNRESFELDPGASLRAHVAGPAGDLASAHVKLGTTGQRLSHPLTCVTGEDGECRIVAIPPGRFVAHATAEGHVAAFETLVLPADAPEAEVEMELVRSVRLVGTVEGVEDYPETDFKVTLTAPDVPYLSAPVDAQGRFALNDAPATSVTLFVLGREGWSRFAMAKVDIPGDRSEHTVALRLPRPLVLAGRVTREGEGCGACTVRLSAAAVDFAPTRLATGTGFDGEFRLRVPKPGLYEVRVTDSDSGARLSDVIELRASRRVEYELATGTLRGTVYRRGGEPVRGASVEATGGGGVALARTETDSLGRFRIAGLTGGELRLTASGDGGTVTRSLTLDPEGMATVDLVLPGERDLLLRVHDEESGLPVPRVDVLVLDAGNGLARHPGLRPDDRGLVRVPVSTAPPWIVVLGALRYATRTLYGVLPASEPLPVALTGDYTGFEVLAGGDLEPCAFELLRADGLPVALSSDVPPGPVPFHHGSGFFNSVERGVYTAVLHTCDDRRLAYPLDLSRRATSGTRVARFGTADP